MEGKIREALDLIYDHRLLLKDCNKHLMSEWSEFIDDIANRAKDYFFVSLTERRCFNLAYSRLEHLNNLVTNNGLLLQYRELADYYVSYKFSFPKILLVDDIILHGRGLSKTLCTLETLLVQDLSDRGVIHDFSDYYRLHQGMVDAIDVFVYAVNQGELLIDDQYLEKIVYRKKLYSGELRDLSIQLSSHLKHQDIANTSFICSLRNRQMSDYLLGSNPLKGSKWLPLSVRTGDEKANIFIRLFEENGLQRISTIRLSTKYEQNPFPQITSFSFLGGVASETMEQLCALLALRFLELGCSNLSLIMKEEKGDLRSSQGQLIYYILSVSDFWKFCDEALPAVVVESVRKDTLVDTPKIAVNLGSVNKYRTELLKVISEKTCRKLAEEMEDILRKANTGKIWSGKTENFVKNVAQIDYIDAVSDTFYQIGIDAEKRARMISRKKQLFLPFRYQEGVEGNVIPWKDGMVSIYGLLNYELRKNNIDIIQYIAAIIYLMDSGVLSVKCHWMKETGELIALARAGELSLAHFLWKISPLIPALALAEQSCFQVGDQCAEFICNLYFEAIHPIVVEPEKFQFDSNLLSTEGRNKIKNYDFEKNWLLERLYMLYSSGQNFCGWNFENATKQTDDCLKELQKKAKEQIENME